ncbi:hypothetical protein EBB79_22570 (plasmid) [Parasedimentitalea marina]|uniref:Uncharacterized protein n=1 Tax=Parasedimentitalea marina TaxID=2483033 RepID=A0A3T0N9S5_9RHOB|nr:hypothetical protein EBB79_22570 [Parasedimentitalea marina]
MSQQFETRDAKHQRFGTGKSMLDNWKAASLGTGAIHVQVAVERQPTFVGLADIEMRSAKTDQVSTSGL